VPAQVKFIRARGAALGPRWLHSAIAAVLIGLFLLQALWSMSYMSLAYDEPAYIGAGYSYWTTRDDRMNAEHPPLLKFLIALPLLSLRLTAPTSDPSWPKADDWAFARALFSEQPRDFERITFLSRISNVLLGVLLALFVRRWANELWGPEAGLAALLLFVFEPNILGNSTVAMLDLGLTAFTFIAMFYVWKWLRTGRTGYGMLASVTLGFSLLSKEAAVTFLAIFLAQLLIDDVTASRAGLPRYIRPFKGFVQLLAGAGIVVILFYALAFQWRSLVHVGSQHRTMEKVVARIPALKGAQERVLAVGQRIWIPDVANYAEALLRQRQHLIEGHASYVMGRHSVHALWYDYPAAFLIKTPLPILLLVLVRLILLSAFPMAAAEYIVVLPIIGIMIIACSASAYLGVRQLLPLYPFLFVWLSRVVALPFSRPMTLTRMGDERVA
jgi:dolichyl-phosphate-mannose--protein O-mannosyl transferase